MDKECPLKVHSIGFTKTSAEAFFSGLIRAGVKKVIDVRLNNVSQLAGFAKKEDLKYFLYGLGKIEYIHLPGLAPTDKILSEYRENRNWSVFEEKFINLIKERRIENLISPIHLDHGCLLCSEHTPNHCHRRLVAEYLKQKWGNIEISHIIPG
jgi:uncharacterized protein (DUF488 family)